MIINTNPVAIDIHRRLKINRDNNSKSLEKLSSGMSINRAGDDAAGLAISEKMRGQIRGLNQASRNTQDGISLIQTAEGSLNEIHAILQRMRELVIEGSNDTLTDEDRELIQQEVVHMKHGIDDIAHNTEFNTIKLLNGSLEDINSRSTKPLTLEWDVEIESPKYITSITKTSDGGVIVAGASDDSSHHIENQRSSWMAKINSDGIVEWEKFPPKDGEYNVVYDIKETSNGDFILSTRSSHNYNFPIVYKLDNKGDIKGKSRLTGMFEKFLTNVIETNEGNFVFTGSHFGGRHDISIVVMDNELNVLETKEVKTPNEQDRWDAHDIRQTHDGGYIIAGLLQTDNGQLGMVIKLDENFQIQWSSFVEDENFKSIIEDKDGNFIVLGKKIFILLMPMEMEVMLLILKLNFYLRAILINKIILMK